MLNDRTSRMEFASTEASAERHACAGTNRLGSSITDVCGRIWNCSRLLRLPSSLSGGALVFWLARHQASVSLRTSAYAAAATLCGIGATFSLNDATDYQEDAINNPSRPIARGSLSVAAGVSFYLWLASLSLFFGALANFPHTFLLVVLMLVSISLYSLVLKDVWFLKNVFVALTIAMLPLMASSCAQVPFGGIQWPLVIALFLWSLENEILMDVRDMEGDRRVGLVTAPMIFGGRPTTAILTVVNLAMWVAIFRLIVVDHVFLKVGWTALLAAIHTGLVSYLGAQAAKLWIKKYLQLQRALVAAALGSLILSPL